MLRDLGLDLRHGLRTLRRSPGFGVMVVLTLAVGIAANAAIFSLVNAVLLRSLPVKDPGQLVLFSRGDSSGRVLGLPADDTGRIGLYTYPLYKQLRDSLAGVELAAQDSNPETSLVRGPAGKGEAADVSDRADGREVSANFFSVLGVPAHRGRTFLPDDETVPGANPVVVLSHSYWQRRFGGDPQILGARLTINGAPYTVVGVAAPGFTGAETGSATDFWVPVTMANEFGRFGIDVNHRSYWWLSLVGRLRPGTASSTVEAAATAALKQYVEADPSVARNKQARARARVELESGRTGRSQVRGSFREPLLVLMAGVGLLLLIVCLNVSYLLLARAVKRQQELSIRTALGASRARLVRQLLAEGLLLAGLGGALGALLTRWLKDGLLSMVSDGGAEHPLTLDTGADGRVMLFLFALALGCALVIGLVPALQAARANLQQAVRSTSHSVTGGSRRIVSRILLVSQVAFSLVLLVGAGLLSGSLGKLRQLGSGLDEEHVLLAKVNVQMSGLGPDEAQRVYDEVQRRVEALPGVRSASLSVPDVLTGGRLSWGINFPGTSRPARGAQFYLVTPGYFETMGLKLVRGRSLARTDAPGAPRVTVINEALAKAAFDGDALGQRITLDGTHDVEVVGIVADARTNDLRRKIDGTFYLPLAQPHGTPATLLASSLEVRATGDPSLLAHQVGRAVREAHSGLPFLNVRTLRAQVDRTLRQDRLLATLASAFGLTALFLVAVGLYGVIAQWAAQRTREIGVRMALGATSNGVRWLVLRQGVALVLVGLALGIPAALAASRLLKGVLFGVQPVHLPTLGGAALAMFAVAALAAYLPARRASRVDPMAALRVE